MKIEHVAYNVEDPAAMARWQVEHLGLTIKRSMAEPPYAHFLADDGDTVMLELYSNPQADVPDYHTIDPIVLHLAFVSTDVEADRDRLMQAGATPVGDILNTPGGDRLAMLRDPWGFAVQLVQRAEAMI